MPSKYDPETRAKAVRLVLEHRDDYPSEWAAITAVSKRLGMNAEAAFTEMGPAWVRWVQATIPDDTVSYARLRVLTALKCQQEGLTMTKLAEALEVTGRRVTALVDALADDGLVERYAHPTDGRSTIVEITEAGREQQRQVWEEHQSKVAVVFGDLSDEDQVRLLDISHKLTVAFRGRLAELNAPAKPVSAADPDAVLIRNNRRVRAARPQSS